MPQSRQTFKTHTGALCLPLVSREGKDGSNSSYRVPLRGSIRITIRGSREWKNGSNVSCNCTPFLHSLVTKGRFKEPYN